jgi:hypothetical protein
MSKIGCRLIMTLFDSDTSGMRKCNYTYPRPYHSTRVVMKRINANTDNVPTVAIHMIDKVGITSPYENFYDDDGVALKKVAYDNVFVKGVRRRYPPRAILASPGFCKISNYVLSVGGVSCDFNKLVYKNNDLQQGRKFRF